MDLCNGGSSERGCGMTHRDPSLANAPSLISRLLSEMVALITTEFALAKAELSQNVTRMGNGLVFCGVAALLGLTAFHLLAAAAALGLAAAGLPLVWAVLIVGVALILAALVCFLVGRAHLKVRNLRPSRTLRNLQADMDTLEEAKRA